MPRMTAGGGIIARLVPGNPGPRQDQSPSPRRRWGLGRGESSGSASSTYCRFTSARLAPAPVRIKEGGDAPPAVILAALVPAEGGD